MALTGSENAATLSARTSIAGLWARLRSRLGDADQVDAGAMSGRLVVDVRNVTFRYGENAIIRDLSTRILRGDLHRRPPTIDDQHVAVHVIARARRQKHSSAGEIFALIWNGAPAPKSEMKPMKGTLTEKNVWEIVNYLRSIGPAAAAARPPASPRRPAETNS